MGLYHTRRLFTAQDSGIPVVAVRVPSPPRGAVPREGGAVGSPSPRRAFGSPQQPVRLSCEGSMAAPEGSRGRPGRSRSDSSSSGPGSGGRAPPPTRRLTRHPTDAGGSFVGGSLAWGSCPPPSLKARKVVIASSAADCPRSGRDSSDSAPDAHPASMSEPGEGGGVLLGAGGEGERAWRHHRAATPPGSPGMAADADGTGPNRRRDGSKVLAVEEFAELLERALQPLRAAQLAGSALWPGKRRLDDFPEVPCDCVSGASGSKSRTPEVTGFVMDSDCSSKSKSGDESSECSSERLAGD